MPYEYSDAQKQKYVDEALKAGISQGYIDAFLAQNGGAANGDYNRLQSSYNSQHEGQGQDSMQTGGRWVPNPKYVAPTAAQLAASSRPMTFAGLYGPPTSAPQMAPMGAPQPFTPVYDPRSGEQPMTAAQLLQLRGY